ncbi:hypothetical protein TCAL_15027 [Tigriopus californicus]|uniref:Ig-like domain-containing protein n=1 Tax=Tigriopus californicus TaxID=6832 RepID=A0A553NXC4_TIGCA|nr:hypothetical protein TCAL_15027 [Tigriopus californicus]
MLKLLDAMISLLIALSLTGWVQAHVTQGGDLTDQSVPNSLNASITFFTSHAEILEGSKFQFKCQIQMLELDAPIHAVELIFVPASEDKVRRLAVDDRLDQGLSSAMRKRMRMVTRRRWDAIEDVNIEEHYLTIDPLILEDQGMYVCQVEAYPVPVVTWYRVTSKIIPPNEEDIKLHRLRIGDEYSFSISGYQDGQMLSSLRIHQVESDHFGRYRCSAKNKEGQDSMEFELTESAEPVDFLKLDISHEPDTKEAGKDNNLPISARNGFEIYGKKMFNAAQTPGNTWTNMGMLMTALNSIAYLLVHHASL